MKVVAVSDLHGHLPEIPPCDVLLIGGDIAPDAPWSCGWNPELMEEWQADWMQVVYGDWETTLNVGAIYAIPGNHDWFIRPSSTSQTQGVLRTTFLVDEWVILLNGWKLHGTPWVEPCGSWHYQATQDKRALAFAMIDEDVDIILSHGPMYQVFDKVYSGEHVGCKEMRAVVDRIQPKYFLSGHIHEGQRWGREMLVGKTHAVCLSRWTEGWTPYEFDVLEEKA